MKTTHVVRAFSIGLASTWLLATLPAAAASGGSGGMATGGTGGTFGKGGTGGGGTGGGFPGCNCEITGTGQASNLGGAFGTLAIGACLWRIGQGRRNRKQ